MTIEAQPIESWEEGYKRWVAEEKPKIDAFEANLNRLRQQFAEGKIDENSFFKELIDSTEPFSKDTNWLANQSVSISRTKENTLEITRNSVLSPIVPVRIQALLRIDDDGKLEVKGIATWNDLDSDAPPIQYDEEDEILSSLGGIGISKQEWANSFAYALLGIEMPDYIHLFELNYDGLLISPEEDLFRDD